MLKLIVLHGAQRGLFPAELLPLCAQMGLQIQEADDEKPPELENLVLVDFLDTARSVAYIRGLRERDITCFPLLVAPEGELPPVSDLLTLRVAAYLPTPVTPESAAQALRQGVAQVQLFRNCYIPRNDLKQLRQSLELSRISRLYEQAVTGLGRCPGSLADFNEEFGTRFPAERIACVSLQVEPPESETTFPRNPAWPYVQSDAAAYFEKEGVYAALLRLSGFCGYLFCPEGRSVEALAKGLYRAVRRVAVPTDLVTVGYAGPADDLEGLPDVLRGAVSALRSRLCEGTERVLPAPPPRRELGYPLSREALTRLRSCVETGDAEGAGQEIAAAVAALCAPGECSARSVYAFALRVYEILRDTARRQAPEGYAIGSEGLFYFDLDCCRTPEMAREMLTRWTVRFLEAPKRRSRYSEPIAASLEYIDSHLDQTLPLRDLARQVRLSPSYYSSLFKRQVGSSFCEYLQSRRIAAAMELLSATELPIAQVAARVGFADYRYFSRIFSRHTGLSPTQYRRQHAKPAQS